MTSIHNNNSDYKERLDNLVYDDTNVVDDGANNGNVNTGLSNNHDNNNDSKNK